MNILNKVTLKGLKKNKIRTIVTVIGIILSTAMICAVTTFAASLRDTMLRSAEYDSGRWFGMAYNVSFEEYQHVSALEGYSEKGSLQTFGYAKLEGIKNDYKPYVKLVGVDQGFFNLAPVHLISGRLPESPDEVLVCEHLRLNGGVALKEGDTLTLSVGDRYSAQTGEELLFQAYEEEETLTVKREKTYTVVGFCSRLSFNFEPYSDPGYTVMTLMDQTPAEDCAYSFLFRLPHSDDIYSFLSENQIANSRANSNYLMYMGTARYSGFSAVLYSLMAVVISIIILGSVSLIYNAFSISVSERTKQFGLLSSVGATKKQLRSMVFREAVYLSAVGIPIGIFSGIAGVGITLHFLKDTVASMFEGDRGFSLSLSVSWLSVVGAVMIALGTVLISAWIPSRRAQKVTAIEAIRQSADIKTRAKDVKVSRFTYRLFGLEGLLAKKHFKRNRKRYRATVISLSLSIILFISAAAFSNTLISGVSTSFESHDYSIRYDGYLLQDDESFPKSGALFSQLKNTSGVTGAACAAVAYGHTKVQSDAFSADYREILEEEKKTFEKNKAFSETYETTEQLTFSSEIWFLDDETYAASLSENGIAAQTLHPDENTFYPMIFTEFSRFNHQVGKFYTYSVLSDSTVSALQLYLPAKGGDNAVENFLHAETDDSGNIIGGRYLVYDGTEDGDGIDPGREIVKNDGVILSASGGVIGKKLPFCIGREQGSYIAAILVWPESAREILLGDSTTNTSVNMYFQSSDTEKTVAQMKQTLSENGLSKSGLIDVEADERSARSTLTFVNVFSYGFIVLISLISVANVFNTITTNINLRRREFAMLKTVGMTAKGFRKMMNFECFLYGFKAIVYGLPIAFFFAWLINQSMNFGVKMAFSAPWPAVGISVFCVFAVVFVSMLFSMSKIKKDNPIDALRNENL